MSLRPLHASRRLAHRVMILRSARYCKRRRLAISVSISCNSSSSNFCSLQRRSVIDCMTKE